MPTAITVDRSLKTSNNLSDVTSAASARTNLGAASSGANSDITSLGAITVGDFNSNAPQLALRGSSAGGDLLTFSRNVGVNAGFAISLGGGRFNVRNSISNITGLSFNGTELLIGESGGGASRDAFLSPGTIVNVNNVTGGALYISSGLGTGSATPNHIYLRTATPTTSGNTAQTHTTRMLLSGDGNIGFGTTTPGCYQFSGNGVAITSGTAAATNPGAGNLSVANNISCSGFKRAFRTITANYTITASDFLIFINAANNAVTVTLPSAVGNGGKPFRLIRIDNSANAAVVVTNPNTQTINSNATLNIGSQYTSIDLESNDLNWFIS